MNRDVMNLTKRIERLEVHTLFINRVHSVILGMYIVWLIALSVAVAWN